MRAYYIFNEEIYKKKWNETALAQKKSVLTIKQASHQIFHFHFIIINKQEIINNGKNFLSQRNIIQFKKKKE